MRHFKYPRKIFLYKFCTREISETLNDEERTLFLNDRHLFEDVFNVCRFVNLHFLFSQEALIYNRVYYVNVQELRTLIFIEYFPLSCPVPKCVYTCLNLQIMQRRIGIQRYLTKVRVHIHLNEKSFYYDAL